MSSITSRILVILAVTLIGLPLAAQAEEGQKSESWLPSLQTETPKEGFELALKLSRMGVKSTQPDKDVLFRERAEYSQDGEALIHASEVVAIHFQTVAAANNYWK
ncbi:Hexameric tyrosine-coordinated heme protein (HTHP) [Marinobacter daqiaonensis]|uniref:Hexameric tyrosine-coordinated heme protein (HTHP) n=1 Tax=Marinobacter daqiaonensis TaxID=650891 RepID=A0A1I6HQB5_9GAMM|nr:hexameric tyrosine-coordinated heme protein [Marinobacter daqiaonensis]SFR56578.1 Hexameric tyrosine-coordinated heme protein (HTHP) [Marinobacter daqiaonensis]